MPLTPTVHVTPSRVTIVYDPKSVMEYQECIAIVSTSVLGRDAQLLKHEVGSFYFKVFPRTLYTVRLRVSIKEPVQGYIYTESKSIEFTTPGMHG